jgi:RND family efflux transporter MFP subunit
VFNSQSCEPWTTSKRDTITIMTDTHPSSSRHPVRRALKILIVVLIPIAILLLGAHQASTLMRTAPMAERQGRPGAGEERGRLVDVMPLGRSDQVITVDVMGPVIPAQRVRLQPRVAGEIIEVSKNLEPGGIVEAGETIVRIDPADYELAVRQREADLAVRQAQLASVQVEYESRQRLRQENVISATEFASIKADYDSAMAQVDNAEALLERARLDLQRTEVRAPFAALVLDENTEVGAIATTSTALADLVSIDRFWVELSVPLDQLRWVDLPDPEHGGGSEVRITDRSAWPEGASRMGRVARFTANVDEDSRMATLLVEVEDPLGRASEATENESETHQLLVGAYVQAEILGRNVPGAILMSREHLHEGDTAWVMDEEDRLRIRSLEVPWRGRDIVLVANGLNAGERLVTTDLSAPVEGMRLRTSSPTQIAENELEAGAEEAGAGEGR